MGAVKFEFEGLDDVLAIVQAHQDFINSGGGADFQRRAGEAMLSRTRERFLREVDPEGNRWIPSVSGQARKASGGGGTLYDTGNLYRSIRYVRRGTLETSLETPLDYAAKHQFGLEGMPARPFLGFSTSDVDELLRIFGEELDRKLSGV